MSEESKVCICIPNYNNEVTLSQTLDSLINQTYKNIIIKVFDNASTDKSIEILNEYKAKYSNFEVYFSDENIGAEGNFTRCIENMEGKYSAIYHSDDLYSPTMIEEQVKYLDKNLDLVAVSTHANIIDENSEVVGQRYIPQEYKGKTLYKFATQISLFKKILEYGNFITCPSVMARTDIYKNKIKFWNGKQYKTSADLEVWLRLSECGSFGYILKPLMKYRESVNSYSFKDMRVRTDLNNMFLVLNHYLDVFEEKKMIDNNDMSYYHFLVFKDNINRTINQIISNKMDINLAIDIFNFKIMKVAISSKEKLKIYIIGCLVRLLRCLWIPTIIRKKISEKRFKKNK